MNKNALANHKYLEIGDVVREGDLTYDREGGWHFDESKLGLMINDEHQAKMFIRESKPKIDEIKRGTEAEGYLRELCLYYANDRIAPGLQSAWLPDKEIFYVAVHRFPKGTVDSRSIISKASGESLADAEKLCMDNWRAICKQVEASRASKPN